MASASLEALLHTANLALDVDIDIVALGDALVVQDRCIGAMAATGSKTGGQQLVIDLEQAARRFGGALGLGHDGRYPLADEAHDIVEDVGVVRVD